MKDHWLFILQVLPIFALLISLDCIKKKDSRKTQKWTFRNWLICSFMWMLPLCIFNNKIITDENEIICKTVMTIIQSDPNNPTLTQIANNTYYNLPTYNNGKYQKELRQYVQNTTEFWDNCKEFKKAP